MKRLDGETFEQYKERRKWQHKRDRMIMGGSFVFVSSAPFVADNNTPGFKNGQIVRKTATYRKPKEEKCQSLA